MQTQASSRSVMVRLSILMFLQFWIWGSWYISVSLYMMENGMGDVRYYAYTAGPLAAIIAPFFTGLFADRFFNTEKVLAGLFLLGGGFMLLLPWVGGLDGTVVAESASGIATAMEVEVFGMTFNKGELFNWTILAHMLCYMPTLALTASLSFHHLPKGSTQFPLVRLWGTVGWIAAGFFLAFAFKKTLAGGEILGGELQASQFFLGGGASVLLGLFCLALPKTPAPLKGKALDVRTLLFADAWRQLRRSTFAVFMIGSFLVCIPLAAYYASLQQQMEAMGFTNIAAWKNTGTFLEAGMMFLMPWFFRKLGVRWMIIAGIGAWALRYVLFSLGASPDGFWLVVGGIALHGICYDFFFVTGQVFVDQATPREIRAQAQSMTVFFTQGLGLFVGAIVANELAARAFGDVASNTPASLELWPQVWWPLCAMAVILAVLFVFAFRPEGKDT
ncbi:MAG: MFS transporter [Planctomycetes bacterium]|nr:MFS transporter [Planctomycetota bacterium]